MLAASFKTKILECGGKILLLPSPAPNRADLLIKFMYYKYVRQLINHAVIVRFCF